MRKHPPSAPAFIKSSAVTSIVAALCLSTASAFGTEIARWNLADSLPEEGEHLLYRLSYRGLFTSFIWKDLADIAFVTTHSARPFQQQPSCDLYMKMSTEDYALSEMFHATRYEWHSTVDPSLRHVFLVEESDTGKHQERTATWVNWSERRIELFRQRERLPAKRSAFFFGRPAKPEPQEWEGDGSKALPAFLNTYPLIDDKYTPLIYDKSIDLPALDGLLDPLSLIYAARWHNYDSRGDLQYSITYNDEINTYQARSLGHDFVDIAGTQLPAHKIEIQRADQAAAEEQGFLILWLSDDEWRVPLQFEIKSKLGRIKVHIVPASLRDSRRARHCTTVTRQTAATQPVRDKMSNRNQDL